MKNLIQPLSRPVGGLLALLLSANALAAQSIDDKPSFSIAGGGHIYSNNRIKINREEIIKYRDEANQKITKIFKWKYKYDRGGEVEVGGIVYGPLENEQINNSPESKNQEEQENLKGNQLATLISQQHTVLRKHDEYNELISTAALEMEIINSDSSNISEFECLLLEEEVQLELLKKNLNLNQEISLSLENINQYLTEEEKSDFDHIRECLDNTSNSRPAALFFELEYLNFLVLGRVGLQQLPADDRPAYEKFKADLTNYNYSNDGFSKSDDLLNLQEEMIDWENKIHKSQNPGTEIPVTPSVNDQPTGDQPVADQANPAQSDNNSTLVVPVIDEENNNNPPENSTLGDATTPKSKHQKAPYYFNPARPNPLLKI